MKIGVSGQVAGHAYGVRGAAVNPSDGSVFVSDVDSHRVIRIDRATKTQSVAALMPDVKTCALVLNVAPCEPGLVDHAPAVQALAFSAKGDLFISDAGQATIWRVRPGQKIPTQWYSSADLATGDGPAGLAFGPTGSLVFAAGTTLDTSSINGGALYSLAINADGTAGTRTLLAAFASGDRPGAVAVTPRGAVYSILRGRGTIVILKAGMVTPFASTGSPIPLDGPAGLAVHDGRLLITNGTASRSASRWAVLSFPSLIA